MESYFEALGAMIPQTAIASKDGLSYLSAAAAMQQAGNPEVTFVDFYGQPYMELFGGSVVAVDIALPAKEGDNNLRHVLQRTWLPVMDQNNRCIALNKTTVSDINNARQRCLVKAIATVLGHGMSVFLGMDGDGQKATKVLGLRQGSGSLANVDLAKVEPVLDKLASGEPYLGWNFALAAARTVDPHFFWEVVQWQGKPYREVLGGVYVDLETIYRGKTQCLSLPMMDEAFNPIPIEKANVWLWNRTVMRALAKAIAFTTGYGLKVYADDFGKTAQTTEAKPTTTSVTDAHPASAKGAVVDLAPRGAVAQQKKSDESLVSTVNVTEPESKPEVAKRFQPVIEKRYAASGAEGLLSLFEAIDKSVKYAEDEKPICYALLLRAFALLPVNIPVDPESLLKAMAAYQVVQRIFPVAGIVAGISERIRAKLVALCVRNMEKELMPMTTETRLELFFKSGLVSGESLEYRVQDLVRLAKLGGIPEDRLVVDLGRDVPRFLRLSLPDPQNEKLAA